MIKKVSLIAAALIAVSLMSSCSGAPDSEILGALEGLAPKASELYGVVYGDSLPHGEEDESGMCVVSEDAQYQSRADISAALKDVFTNEYASTIEITAFRGVSADEGEISPKFFEQNGVFYVCPSSTEDFNVPDGVDLTGAKVVKKNRFMAKVNIPLGEGEEDDVEVTLKLVDGVWKIDSPLF